MSQVTGLEATTGIRAGNTVESLQPKSIYDALPSAADLDAYVAEVLTAEPTVSNTPAENLEEFLDEENTFDVSRAEFNELRDSFLRFIDRIGEYNKRAPHKI
jgi:hypothetical protein